MAKVRAEHAEIEAPAIPHPHDRLVVQLICEAESWRKSLPCIVDIAVEADTALARHTVHTLNQIRESTVILTIHVLGEINFPSQAIVQRELWRDAPSVLPIIEHTMLPLGGIGGRAHIAVHGGNVTKKECRPV